MLKRKMAAIATMLALMFYAVSGFALYGCMPNDNTGYEFVEFGKDELLKETDWIMTTVEDLRPNVKCFVRAEDLNEFFREYLGKNMIDYIAEDVFTDNVVFGLVRSGYEGANYRYENFVLFEGHPSIDLILLKEGREHSIGGWIDFVIVPEVAANGVEFDRRKADDKKVVWGFQFRKIKNFPPKSKEYNDGYPVVEFAWTELAKECEWVDEIVSGEKTATSGHVFVREKEISQFFSEYFDKDWSEYFAANVFQDNIIATVVRYGYDKKNVRYSKFVILSSRLYMDRTILDPDSDAPQSIWFDFVVIPRLTANGRKFSMYLSYIETIGLSGREIIGG